MQSRPRVIHCGYIASPYLPGRARSDRDGPRKGQTDPSRTDASRIWRKAEKERSAGNREATLPRSAGAAPVAGRQPRFERLRPRQQRLPLLATASQHAPPSCAASPLLPLSLSAPAQPPPRLTPGASPGSPDRPLAHFGGVGAGRRAKLSLTHTPRARRDVRPACTPQRVGRAARVCACCTGAGRARRARPRRPKSRRCV